MCQLNHPPKKREKHNTSAKYVSMAPNGIDFIATVKKHGKRIELGPFHSEREAFEAMRERVEQMPRKRERPPLAGPTSPFTSRVVAARQLGIGPTTFDRHWARVFTQPLSCHLRYYRDELEVAMQAGGGTMELAKVAVATFRIGLGRLGSDATQHCKQVLQDDVVSAVG